MFNYLNVIFINFCSNHATAKNNFTLWYKVSYANQYKLDIYILESVVYTW